MALSPRALLFALPLLVAAPTAGHADWTVYGGSPQHTGVAEEALPAPLSVLWKHSADYQKDNSASPIVDGDTAYFAAKDRVYAVRTDSGELKWKMPSGDQPGSITYRSTPAVANGNVYIGASDGGMYALDAKNGSQKWKFPTGAMVKSHPLVAEDTLYFGSDDDYFYAIDANTGDLRWKYHATADVESAATFAADSQEFIYFASSDGHVYGLNRATGKPKWTARTVGSSGPNSLVAFQNRLYIAAGSQIYAFRPRSGEMETMIASNLVPKADITCTPVFTSDPTDPSRAVVYFGDRDGNFYCYAQSRLTWKPAWNKPVLLDGPVNAMPVLAGGMIFAGADKGFVYGINATDGTLQWKYQLEAPLDLRVKYKYFNINAPLVVSDHRLYVLGDDGTLNAFSTDGIDIAGPTITQPRPARGTTINGLPPLNISASLWDVGSGINPSTVLLKMDGQPMEASKLRYNERRGAKPGVVYDPVQRKLEYNSPRQEVGQRAEALKNGRHTVEVEATDWKGNTSTMEWSFVVDNTLPVKPRVQPGTTPGTPGTPGYGSPGSYGGPGGAPGSYGQPGSYGNQGTRARPQPRRRPVRGGNPQPNNSGYGYGGRSGGS